MSWGHPTCIHIRKESPQFTDMSRGHPIYIHMRKESESTEEFAPEKGRKHFLSTRNVSSAFHRLAHSLFTHTHTHKHACEELGTG